MEKLTIRQIEEKMKTIELEDDPFLQSIKQDDRKGVQQLLAKWHSRQLLQKKIYEKHKEMTRYECQYRSQGFQLIAGIDEVGRGPLAGPVVAAAVILPENFYLPGLDDSKKVPEQKRAEYYEIINAEAEAVSVGIIESDEIDRINIFEATKKAMLSAIEGLNPKPDFLLVDAVKLLTPYPMEAIIKGDGKSVTIAAASIIAKVTRDRMMAEIGKEFPQYGFGKNMGYGTKEHLEAITLHGITPYHRKSFAPIKDSY
ncbi:MAG: ribonuclease HII [Bacillota bacterium]|jgi:ribonuclease HII|uniref:ribonuclease HII n=1 Tax=Bacillaceae TaxID=186817 RepID=UPI0013D89152|nr:MULTISPECIES: ribonuclease HII [Bacillaceae]MBG9445432.1 ribonuclease H [Cytobacillus firmus]MBG9450273.1 ribonuclease H [Cytobacillus firmus]MCS0652289.1 ribonuclease HII [Cytobacillus firmus]MCU1804502.1 ribonuclease HII [Cytobacillus firmus]URT72583.1 ribonuclease HII [Cytobacillus firmus]